MLSNIREASDVELEAKLQEKVILSLVKREMSVLTDSITTLAKTISALELKHGEKGETGEKGIDGVNGRDGKDGKDGKNGLNGKDGLQGKQGEKGDNGADGKDGVSVVDAQVTFDNHLVLTLSNGSEIDAGEIYISNNNQVVQMTQVRGAEETVTYTTRYDQVSEVLAYKGEALVGSLDSAPVWRIQKLVFNAEGDVTITWVNGNADFRYVWNDRNSLTYS